MRRVLIKELICSACFISIVPSLMNESSIILGNASKYVLDVFVGIMSSPLVICAYYLHSNGLLSALVAEVIFI